MKLSWNLFFQALLSLVHYGNLATGIVPANLKIWVALVIALAQGLIGWRQAYFNPDGTPAATAYQK